MSLITYVLGFGVISLFASVIGFRTMMSTSLGPHIIESFVYLISKSVALFNRRLMMILIQLIVVTNACYVGLCLLSMDTIHWQAMLLFDGSILIFSGIVAIILQTIPNSVSVICNKTDKHKDDVIQSIIQAGIYKNIAFFSGFVFIFILGFLSLGSYGFLAVTIGLLVISFYFRSAGGAYKAAAEQADSADQTSRIMTHPTNVLSNSGTLIASIGGFYLDIYSSWMVAIASFFVYVNYLVKPADAMTLLGFAEVKWVFWVILITGISSVLMLPLSKLRKNKANIYLDMGYIVLLIKAIGISIMSYKIGIEDAFQIVVSLGVTLIVMLGIIFFTNFLTSKNHRAIKFIARQAQYGSSNVLITSFFNGLFGNAVFMLILLVGLTTAYNYIDLLGVIMVIIYGLSITVVACNLKVFSLLSNQVMQTLDKQENAFDRVVFKSLEKVSYTLVAIGNSLSTVAGILSSTIAISTALAIYSKQVNLFTTAGLLGFGLGIIVIFIFYAISISGTYETLVVSAKEIARQLVDIPSISQANKAHPNIEKLADRHAINGLKAVTLPGIWSVTSLTIIVAYLAEGGLLAALLGIIGTLYIYSFFWAIFGDSVIAVYNEMKNGNYGGRSSSVFKGVCEAFLYAHYFQWVLAPTGVIMMKVAAVIAIVTALT